MRHNWIKKCFDSVLSSSIPVNIVAVDNNSADESVKYIRESYPAVHLIENNENKGFGGANNQGLKYALDQNTEYFFLLNQDAWVEHNTIEELVKHTRQNTDYGIVSPMHYNGKGNALDYMFSRYIAPERCKNIYSDFVVQNVNNTIYESGFICAAAWLITKKTMEVVGGFSPTFYHYGEDDNYVQRLLYKGLKIGVLPTVKIYHDRENRPSQPVNDYKPKELALKFSSPNRNKSYIETYIKQLQFKLLKNTIFGRKIGNDLIKKELCFLKKNKDTIIENLEKSQSTNTFLFL